MILAHNMILGAWALARGGGGCKSRRSPPPLEKNKNFTILLLYFFLLMAFFYYFFSLWGPFSVCGGLFWSLWGDFFGLAPSPTKISAGANAFISMWPMMWETFLGLPPLGVPMFGLHKSIQ